MVHKRSEKKLQERKDKSFAKRKKVSGHPNCLEWLFSPPVVFQIFFDRYFYIFSFFYIYIFFFFFFFFVFFLFFFLFFFIFFFYFFFIFFDFFLYILFNIFYELFIVFVVYLVSNKKISLGK